VLKPYVTLLFDGFGGVNSRDVSAVMRLTPKQVALWYAGPMAEMRQQAEKQADKPKTDGKPAAMRFDGFEAFKAAFDRFPEYADQPAEWWQQKWGEWKREQGGGV